MKFLEVRAAIFLLLISFTSACKSQTNQEREVHDFNEATKDEEADASEAEKEDEEDETLEDFAQDAEDFDLMCDLYEAPERVQRKPDFIIIGAKKGGTRALIEFLKLHPKIKAAGKEIHYFNNRSGEFGNLDWYLSKMPFVTEDQLATEKTPGYFHTKEVPARIKAMDPNVKLLLILRDPAKRLVSDYNQFRNKNLDKGQEYPDLEELLFTTEGEINGRYPPLQRSIYHVHMRRWLKQFPRNQLHIVNGDQFIRSPWAQLQKVETFLGVEPMITENNFFFNSTKGYYCGKDIRESGPWTCVREKCLSSTKGRPKPPLKDDTLTKLRDFFRPHNEIFYQLVNQTFSWP